MGCMRNKSTQYIRWAAVMVVLVLLAGCAKGADFNILDPEGSYSDKITPSWMGDELALAIGTVRSQDGVRFIRLDEKSCSQVMNPKEIAGIQDGTRVFLQYRYVVSESIADFCTDAILVEWASPLDVGSVGDLTAKSRGEDPVDIILDWMTSLEDGFFTLHYSIPASGNVKHDFTLYRGDSKDVFILSHDAHGDTKGSLMDGLVCFDVSSLLPDTEGKTVKLYLDYIDLNNTKKRLTVEYQSPK